MASGENYGYDQPFDNRNVNPVMSGYDQPLDPSAYTPSPYGNQRGPYPTRQYLPEPQGPQRYYGGHSDHNNIKVVMSQPQISTVVVNRRPNDYMACSVLTLLFCFFPLGIAAVIFSCNSKTAADNLNIERAREEANTAKKLNLAGLVCGVVFIIMMTSLPLIF